MKPIPAAWRDTVLFLAGLSLLIFEAVGRTGPERYGHVLAYLAMMGLPVVLRKDERAADPPISPPPPATSGPPPPTGGGRAP